MPKIRYIEHTFRADTLAVIDQAERVCTEYAGQGFILTLRQLYYQFVARGWLPNTQREYKRLGEIMNDARLAGLIDWNHLEDRTRNLQRLSSWSSPGGIIQSAARSYHTDLWQDQNYRVEVWIEKDALAGVFERVCQDNDVPYFSCRGYTSQSELWGAGQRLRRYWGRTPIILHFGDHDPSGMDMTRDIAARLELFYGRPVEVDRLALNKDQIEQYNPPPNPAKTTDSRYASYIRLHGDESWELDALEPQVLSDLVTAAISRFRDSAKWDAQVARQEAERTLLLAASEHWEELTAQLEEFRQQ